MISEVSFATQHSSLWHILAPNSERFIRHINLNVDRYALEISVSDTPDRRGYLNEVAFQLARLRFSDPSASMDAAAGIAQKNLSNLDRPRAVDLREPTSDEVDGVEAVAKSLLDFANGRVSDRAKVIFAPQFPGCGFLDTSVGDLLIKETLFEVKAGDRLFRSSDLRQLLTYCAMNFGSKKFEMNKAGCINPRLGTYFELDIETIAHEVSGKSSAELFSDMIYFLSSSGISR